MEAKSSSTMVKLGWTQATTTAKRKIRSRVKLSKGGSLPKASLICAGMEMRDGDFPPPQKMLPLGLSSLSILQCSLVGVDLSWLFGSRKGRHEPSHVDHVAAKYCVTALLREEDGYQR